MPELPEVETIVRALRMGGRGQSFILGKVVEGAQVLWKRTLAEPGIQQFQSRIAGQKIREINRRGKFVVIQLNPLYLLFHLRMSGDLRVEPQLERTGREIPLQSHDRLILVFSDQTRLVFNDPRKFGRAWLVENPQRILGELGTEPLDENLTSEAFQQMLQLHSRQLKPLLLDQKFLAGLGNIYTDEALHLAKLHPLMNSRNVSPKQAAGLLKAIRRVLREGIKRNGASIDWVYRGGDFQNHFRVYQCTGEPCPVCGSAIQRIIIGQRSSHYCPVCQPAPSNCEPIVKGYNYTYKDLPR
jgi:formamidopyrimidine-DNA glycosylase